jgi:hypothetical protein
MARKDIKLFVDKRNKRIKELDGEEWLRYLMSCTDVTGHLNILIKELQGITEISDIITAFKITPRLWEDQLKVQNLFHFPHLKS